MSSSVDESTKSTVVAGEARETKRRLIALWEGGSSDWVLPDRGSLDIGRSQTCQLRIDHSSVSRRHAVWHAGAPDHLEDCGSSNGTRINGQRIPAGARVPIRAGDTIEIGRVLLVLQGGHLPEPRAAVEGAMARVRKLVELTAPTSMTVLLLGETGVGKDVLAEEIHRKSPRSKGPFVRLNCAALTETLLESELFGHEKGAFTGALLAKPGLIEAANGGTLLLDEVGEMPPATQAKLLVALERHEVVRVGSVKSRPVDVRFVAATNRDLEAQVASGEFRQDLFYRLNGVSIRIPPLRERVDEIDGLAHAFVEGACKATGRAPLVLAPEAIALLEAQPYPGNIRELRSLLERAVAFAPHGRLDVATVHLAISAGIGGGDRHVDVRAPASPSGLRPEVEALERQRILEALEACHGNQTKAAELLAMPRRTLVSKLSRYGVTRPKKA